MLSRFRTPKEQDEIIQKLADKKLDIVIGTHRLLSADVQFADLGLVIIDEEQRFGVTHKEHLKNCARKLTCSPSPPRLSRVRFTWHLAVCAIFLPSIRHPKNVCPCSPTLGPTTPNWYAKPSFANSTVADKSFLCITVCSRFTSSTTNLARLYPKPAYCRWPRTNARKTTRPVMEDFTHGEIDVLLSTTIIESGLDIPQRHTLIIDRADTLVRLSSISCVAALGVARKGHMLIYFATVVVRQHQKAKNGLKSSPKTRAWVLATPSPCATLKCVARATFSARASPVISAR